MIELLVNEVGKKMEGVEMKRSMELYIFTFLWPATGKHLIFNYVPPQASNSYSSDSMETLYQNNHTELIFRLKQNLRWKEFFKISSQACWYQSDVRRPHSKLQHAKSRFQGFILLYILVLGASQKTEWIITSAWEVLQALKWCNTITRGTKNLKRQVLNNNSNNSSDEIRELQFYNLDTISMCLNEIYLSKRTQNCQIHDIVLHATERLDWS